MKQTSVKKRGVLLSHPTGNTFSRAAATALHQANRLQSFHTCIAVGNDSTNWITKRLYRQRAINIPEKLIVRQPLRESLRLLTQKTGFIPSLRAHEKGVLSVDKVYQGLDQKVSRLIGSPAGKTIEAIYAYEDGALRSFSTAKSLNIRCLYDLPIGYWRVARSIQNEEAELRPDWRATMPALRDSDAKLELKDKELALADRIIVASQFTAKTLKTAPVSADAIDIIPYGCPPARVEAPTTSGNRGKLRVLYVGSLSQRKGLADLLDATSLVSGLAELTIIGRRVGECETLDRALAKSNWIESLPHSQILEQMRAHDVLVFPSLFEGFGLVITEALSQGVPVIASPHTCAPDIIKDGQEGFIVPIRDPDAIAQRLTQLHEDRDLLQAMKISALERARSLTWELYQKRFTEMIERALGYGS